MMVIKVILGCCFVLGIYVKLYKSLKIKVDNEVVMIILFF